MTQRVVVAGGGVCGASAALHLARAGAEVVLVEAGSRLGGLVVSFEVGGTPLECFYHHTFPHETHIRELIGQLGLGDRLGWYPSTVGVFTQGRVWPFTSPLDLLRFSPLPAADRVRTGIGALRMGRVRDWAPLDAVPARRWLARYTGQRAVDVVWDPLLRAKFGPAAPDVPAAWMWGRFQQRAGGRSRGGEQLGYLRGGFRQLFDALDAELRRLGVDVRTDTRVERVEVVDGAVAGASVGGQPVEANAVLFTGPLPNLPALVPSELADPRWSAIGGLGVVCVVLELRRQVSDIYWTNVCDPEIPFGGVIEHTNLVPASDYGRHVMYVSRYFTADEPVARADPAAEAERWIDVLDERWPGFSRRDVLAVHPFRAPYAAPLVRVGYRAGIPPLVSHVPGLFVATTAQIYPEDRGMSEAVRSGLHAAGSIDNSRALVRN